MDKDERILALINKIDSGKVSSEGVAKYLDEIEKKYGPIELLYETEDRDDEEYYEKLLSDARMGLFNRQSILKMAEIKCPEKSNDKKKKIVFLGIVLVFVLVVTGIIIAICRR